MAKITKSEFLSNVQNIINEGLNLNATIDYSAKFNIGGYVKNLFEDGQNNPALMNYLNRYKNMLEGGAKDVTLYEQFGKGLLAFTTGNNAVKSVIESMNTTLKNHTAELKTRCLIESIKDEYTRQMVSEAYENYLNAGDQEAKNILMEALDAVCECGDPAGQKITIIISDESACPECQIEGAEEYVTSSRFDEIQNKIREDKERRRMEDVKAKVDEYARQVFDDAEAENKAAKEACTFESIINNNGLNLRESIVTIANSTAKSNKKLMETMDQYAGALNQGLYEERLVKGFVKNLQPYNYLLPVAKEIKRINEAYSAKEVSIKITELLEEMSTTNSFYIIPIIEEDAARYVKEPSAVNRMQFRQALCSFAGDPYCAAMLEAIETDGIKRREIMEDKVLNIKEQIKLVKEHANVSAIYSPVQYIKENECVFNANGQFYVKKGNTLAKLSDEYLPQLSEKFVTLCQLVNDPRVTINEDSIVLVGNDKIATIFEGYVDINGNHEAPESLRNLNEMAYKYDYDTNFFIMAACLHENFDNIAKIDFGKHISLNENEGINIDMFRLDNNIFINAVNEGIDRETFYHNVNPLQCRNIINKHMGINVASLFEDILPSQDKIMLKLNETKNEYEASIEKYECTIAKLKKAKEEGISEDSAKKLDDAIESAQKKVDELKKEYKDWQSEVDKTTEAKGDDEEDVLNDKEGNAEVEKQNEPIDAKEVENVKDELTQPLSATSDEVTPTDVENVISDDDFDSYLEGGNEVPQEVIEPCVEGEDAGEDTEVSMARHALEGDGKENEEPNEEELVDPIDSDENGFEEVADDELPAEGDEDEFPNFDEVESEDKEDAATGETEDVLEPEETTVNSEAEGYKVASISFDENIKTGKLFKTGNVVVVTPMVGEDGKMYTKTDSYNFYIDEESHLPIVAAADIPVALYNAIVMSIQADPKFTQADSNGEAVVDAVDQEKEENFFDAEDVKDASDEINASDEDAYFDFQEDEDGDSLTISAKEPEGSDEDAKDVPSIKDIFGVEDADSEEGSDEDVIIPAYKDGETEVELPAPSADNTEIPEVSAEEAAKVEDSEDVNIDDLFNDEDESEDDKLPEEGDEDEFPDFDEVEVDEEK